MQSRPDTPQPDDELAAAIIAVERYLAAEQTTAAVDPVERVAGWRVSARLATQGMRPLKLSTAPRWNAIERVRRATHGFEGVHGL